MLTTGIFPDKLKIAKINPVYKKHDETVFRNYRPISLYQQFQKSLKRYFLSNFMIILQIKSYVQYGFRSEHCTEVATLDLVDRVMIEMDKMNKPVNIFGPFKSF